MPSLDLSSLSEKIPAAFTGLVIKADFDLDEDQIAKIKEHLPLKDGAYHASFRKAVELGERKAELGAMIGVHDFELDEPGEVTESTGPRVRTRYLHYDIELRITSYPRTREDGDWDNASVVLAPFIGMHPTETILRLSFEPSSELAIKLPISLGASDTPGFSEIRGVRLVQPDSDDSSKELYSVIIDKLQHRIAVSVFSVIDLDFSGAMLEPALERTMSIANLAVWESP